MSPNAVLQMSDITKSFTGVVALRDVSLTVGQGEVHALVGENGAGKSTLMKVLAGAEKADRGSIAIDGEAIDVPTPKRMLECGVSVIHQELTLAPHLTVAENVFLNRWPRRRTGTVDWRRLRADSNQLLGELGVRIDVDARVSALSIAEQQMVEIAKALSQQARLLVLDEPSAVLGDTDVDVLFQIIERLRQQGVSFVYISHRLGEVFRLADQVTVLRDGRLVATKPVADVDGDQLVSLMVGREVSEVYPPRERTPGEPVLEVEGLGGGMLHDVSFVARRGEILGIAGLAGAGRTELLRAVAGADPYTAGTVSVAGTVTRFRNPGQALSAGIALLPEDRKGHGLFLSHSVRFNITAGDLPSYTRSGVLRTRVERSAVAALVERLRIRTSSAETPVRHLSGGNQQKCLIARWFSAGCSVLLVDEPTRGVDVGAKQEIYRLLDELARSGVAVVMVSSELNEVLGLADRILVLREGTVAAELDGPTATEESIMQHATDHGSTASLTAA